MKTRKHTSKPVMRAATRFQPWDFAFMLDIESKCLLEMAKYFETAQIGVSAQRNVRLCHLMVKLLAIANDEDVDYFELPPYDMIPDKIGHRLEFKGEGKMKKHVNINNAHRFMPNFEDVPIMRNALRQEKAWYLYHRMRKQYLRGFWD